MTWPALVADHDGHWLRFDGPDALRCHPCDRRILLPLRLDLAPTPSPSRWTAPEGGRPMPAWFRDRVAAELDARRRSDNTQESA